MLGVDAGGTSTRAAIADRSGRVLGIGTSSTGNIDDQGPAGTARAVAEAVAAARVAAGVDAADFVAAFLGVAGVVSAEDRAALLDALAPLRLAASGRVVVDHDCRVALAGGLSGRPGIVLIAGTGSSAFGCDASGMSWRAGGWGSLIGDEGSGFRIAVDGVRAVAMAADGRGAETSLTRALLSALEVHDPDGLLHRLHLRDGRSQIAGLAPIVLSEAGAGDPVAGEILVRAMDDLAAMVAAVWSRLVLPVPAEVATVGGLFTAGDVVLAPLREALAQRVPEAVLVAPEADPVVGACLLAAQVAGR